MVRSKPEQVTLWHNLSSWTLGILGNWTQSVLVWHLVWRHPQLRTSTGAVLENSGWGLAWSEENVFIEKQNIWIIIFFKKNNVEPSYSVHRRPTTFLRHRHCPDVSSHAVSMAPPTSHWQPVRQSQERKILTDRWSGPVLCTERAPNVLCNRKLMY